MGKILSCRNIITFKSIFLVCYWIFFITVQIFQIELHRLAGHMGGHFFIFPGSISDLCTVHVICIYLVSIEKKWKASHIMYAQWMCWPSAPDPGWPGVLVVTAGRGRAGKMMFLVTSGDQWWPGLRLWQQCLSSGLQLRRRSDQRLGGRWGTGGL